jgi:hypothetical protein
VYVRVVRFTDATAERIEQLVDRIAEADGPPPDIPTTGIQILFDQANGTAVVLQFYESEDDMRVGDQAFRAMDAADTPGTRASVDMCELKIERHAER